MHLVQREPLTEQGTALGQLGREHRQRMLFYLVLISVEPPAARIAVPPFRPDDHVRMAALSEPAAQEFLCPAIRAGHIDVPDPSSVGSVQHREGPGSHSSDAAVRQVILPAAGDVCRAAQGGQPQPDPRDHWSPGPERCRRHAAALAAVVAGHGRYRTAGPVRGEAPGITPESLGRRGAPCTPQPAPAARRPPRRRPPSLVRRSRRVRLPSGAARQLRTPGCCSSAPS